MIISPLRTLASSKANADFPVPVLPITQTIVGLPLSIPYCKKKLYFLTPTFIISFSNRYPFSQMSSKRSKTPGPGRPRKSTSPVSTARRSRYIGTASRTYKSTLLPPPDPRQHTQADIDEQFYSFHIYYS